MYTVHTPYTFRYFFCRYAWPFLLNVLTLFQGMSGGHCNRYVHSVLRAQMRPGDILGQVYLYWWHLCVEEVS